MKGPDNAGGFSRSSGYSGSTARGAEEYTGSTDVGELAEQRGISSDVLLAAGIRRDTGGGRYDGWWGLPYPHRSGVWKVRYRHPDPDGLPKYLDGASAQFHLYNPLRLGAGEDEVWFAEGEFDTLALIDQGFKAIGIHGISSVPKLKMNEDGTLSDEYEEDDAPKRWRHTWNLLFKDTFCVTMFDNDPDPTKGPAAGRRLAKALGGDAFDDWPPDFLYGDINEWHRADPEGLGVALHRYRHRLRVSKGMEPWG